MKDKVIPRSEWSEFADAFSRQHEKWLTTIRMNDGNKTEVLAENAPFKYMTTRGESQVHIGVMTKDEPKNPVDHVVQHTSRIAFKETEAGAHKGLRIESEEGPTYDLEFRSASPPEEVNGKI